MTQFTSFNTVGTFRITHHCCFASLISLFIGFSALAALAELHFAVIRLGSLALRTRNYERLFSAVRLITSSAQVLADRVDAERD